MLRREKKTQLPGTIFGQFSAPIGITTVHNPFEDATVRLAGIGYFDEVSWDLQDTPQQLQGEDRVDQALFQAPDELNLSSVAVGGEAAVTFHITNTSKDTIRFQFPEALPAKFADFLGLLLVALLQEALCGSPMYPLW